MSINKLPRILRIAAALAKFTFVSAVNATVLAAATETVPMAVDEPLAAQVFLVPGGQFTLADSAKVYGSMGREIVLIRADAAGVILDQNVERAELAGPSSSYLYQQAGNTLKVYSGTTLLVTVPLQSAGTELAFTDGTVKVTLAAGIMTVGGTPVASTPGPITPTTIDPFDPSQVGNQVPDAIASTPQGLVFLSAGNRFNLFNSAKVYGSNGTEQVLIQPGVAGVILDQNVEGVGLAGFSSSYLYQQAGNTLKVYSGTTLLAATVPIQSGGTEVAFGDGTAMATLNAGVMTLGGGPVSAKDPENVIPPDLVQRYGMDYKLVIDANGSRVDEDGCTNVLRSYTEIKFGIEPIIKDAKIFCKTGDTISFLCSAKSLDSYIMNCPDPTKWAIASGWVWRSLKGRVLDNGLNLFLELFAGKPPEETGAAMGGSAELADQGTIEKYDKYMIPPFWFWKSDLTLSFSSGCVPPIPVNPPFSGVVRICIDWLPPK